MKYLTISLALFLLITAPVLAQEGRVVDEQELIRTGIAPNSPLHALQLFGERVSLAFTFDEERRLQRELLHAHRRLADVEFLLQEHDVHALQQAEERHAASLVRLQERTARAEQRMSSTNAQEVLESVTFLRAQTQEQLMRLDSLFEQYAETDVLRRSIQRVQERTTTFDLSLEEQRQELFTRYRVLAQANDSEIARLSAELSQRLQLQERMEQRMNLLRDSVSRHEAQLMAAVDERAMQSREHILEQRRAQLLQLEQRNSGQSVANNEVLSEQPFLFEVRVHDGYWEVVYQRTGEELFSRAASQQELIQELHSEFGYGLEEVRAGVLWVVVPNSGSLSEPVIPNGRFEQRDVHIVAELMGDRTFVSATIQGESRRVTYPTTDRYTLIQRIARDFALDVHLVNGMTEWVVLEPFHPGVPASVRLGTQPDRVDVDVESEALIEIMAIAGWDSTTVYVNRGGGIQFETYETTDKTEVTRLTARDFNLAFEFVRDILHWTSVEPTLPVEPNPIDFVPPPHNGLPVEPIDPIPVPFVREITFTVSDGIHRLPLVLGHHVRGSTDFVQGLDQYWPPPPPQGAFDARIVYADDAFSRKYLPFGEPIRATLVYQPSFDAQNMVLQWNPADVEQFSRVHFFDAYGGTFFSANAADLKGSLELTGIIGDRLVVVIE